MVIPNVFGKRCSYYLVDLSLADAGRVAPIRGSVLCLSFVLGEVQIMKC